jgi:hypothetical protein
MAAVPGQEEIHSVNGGDRNMESIRLGLRG